MSPRPKAGAFARPPHSSTTINPATGVMTAIGPVTDKHMMRICPLAHRPNSRGCVARMRRDQILLKNVWPTKAKAANSWTTSVGT